MNEHDKTASAGPVDLSQIKGVDADHCGVARCGQPITRGVIPYSPQAADTTQEENAHVPG